MSAVNITQDAQSALSSAANFLLSLNAGLGGDNAQADVFSKFLLQSQLSTPQPQPQSQAQSQTQQTQSPRTQNQTQALASSSADATQDTPAPTPPSLSALKKLVTTWRNLVERMQGQANKNTVKHQSNGRDNANASSGGKTTSNTAATSQSTATQGSTGSVDATATDAALASGSTGSGDDTKTIADILKELQMLALLIEKQLQNLQKTGGTGATDTAPASDTASASSSTSPAALDPSQLLADLTALLNPAAGAASGTSNSAGDGTSADGAAATDGPSSTPTLAQALTDLLTLVQLAAKQLESTQTASGSGTPSFSSDGISGADTANTIADNTNAQLAAAVSPLTVPSDTQLKADLKVLLTNLRTSVTADKEQSPNQPASTASADANDASDNNDDASSAASSTDAATSNLSLAAPDASRDAWMQQDDFFNLFKTSADSTFNAQGQGNVNFTPAATANGIVADTGGKDGASSDLDMGGQGNASARNGILNNILDNSNLAGAGNNAASTNPYSFASQLSEARATSGGLTGLPDAVEQVILQLNHNAKNGDDQMTLHLNPADLGRVDIKLNFSSDGKVQGTVVASNPATLHLLLKDVRGLERALQEAGLRADPGSLQFSLGDQSGNSSGQMPRDTSSGSGASGNLSSGATAPDTISDVSALSADTTETYYLTPTRVNMRV